MDNFILKLRTLNPFKVSYVFLDTKDEYVLKRLKDELKINNPKVFSKDGERLNVNIVSFNKKDKDKFLKVMDRIYKDLIILGYKEEELNLLDIISKEI